MKEKEQKEYWQKIGMKVLADPHASRSEVGSAIIGVRSGDNQWLKDQLELKKIKAWKAKNVS